MKSSFIWFDRLPRIRKTRPDVVLSNAILRKGA